MARQSRIFISYSRADALFIEQLVPLLDQVFPDYETWYDQHITGGEDWWTRILAEIDRCDLFIYLLSNDSLASDYCQAEFREALRLQKMCLPIIVRPKTDVSLAPDDLESEVRRRNWIDMSGGFKDAKANAALFRALRLQVNQIPAQPAAPLHPDPVSQPAVSHARKATSTKTGRKRLVAALIGAAAVIVAVLIGLVPPLLNTRQTTPTSTPTTAATATAGTVVAAQPTVAITAAAIVTPSLTETPLPPTATPTLTESATVDFVAAASTFDAQGTAAFKATGLAQTQGFIAGQTATATRWTKTPTPTLTLTPNITASFDAFLTQRAQTTMAQDALNQTATATRWTRTATPTATPTPTQTATLTATHTPLPPTATPYPTASTNKAWTPVSRTFDDGVEMVLVPKGCFKMGTDNPPAGYEDEKPANQVCFDQAFWIDKTDVTQEQFKRLGGTAAHSSQFPGDNHPVDSITWFEARDYCEQKRGARLPTEAEWEHAARGPDSWIYPWGNDFNAANAVYSGNSGNRTANVGSKPGGNSWVGASDMAGNVWQWTSTIYDPSKFPYPYKKEDGRESNGDISSPRVLRGGSFNDDENYLRSAVRSIAPDDVYYSLGIRCARS